MKAVDSLLRSNFLCLRGYLKSVVYLSRGESKKGLSVYK